MSDRDLQLAGTATKNARSSQLPSQMMFDNEPRFETRSPDNQMFSIENEISNLMKSYNMLVDAQVW